MEIVRDAFIWAVGLFTAGIVIYLWFNTNNER
jgi:hypothetical protein